MHHLRLVSFAMVFLGVLTVAASVFFGLSPAWTLSGLLLGIAGAVKVVVVALWRGVASLTTSTELSADDNPPG